ncbi:Type 1 glutamine amidotransferase-like domain-containing protein [Aggregatilinea lenta]|uniref:Type 1 glutamine amidotransferase-like domain-containing protein n=1 Tax=Aggregatilinea lenta TaxID=913108 RepID=UPI000E5A6BC9|nr:Type 1 glutamine amidotransferase-like domain-containing protein [Aggregatilinea lenta]
MEGTLILHGGDAFTPKNKQLHYDWLRLIRGERRPRVSVVPVAELRKPILVAQDTSRYFQGVATFSEYVEITDQLSANTAVNYGGLDKTDAIVLTDGSPVHIVEQLRGTHTEKSLQNTMHRQAALFGVGASAMVMGGVYWLDNTWEPGLALAPHLAIMPRYDTVRMRLSPERLLAELPDGVTLIGIEENTALVCHPEGYYSVLGHGTVTIVRGPDDEREHRSGHKFALDAPADPDDSPDDAE